MMIQITRSIVQWKHVRSSAAKGAKTNVLRFETLRTKKKNGGGKRDEGLWRREEGEVMFITKKRSDVLRNCSRFAERRRGGTAEREEEK